MRKSRAELRGGTPKTACCTVDHSCPKRAVLRYKLQYRSYKLQASCFLFSPPPATVTHFDITSPSEHSHASAAVRHSTDLVDAVDLPMGFVWSARRRYFAALQLLSTSAPCLAFFFVPTPSVFFVSLQMQRLDHNDTISASP